jgi:sporulation protein YlmC with PRC-barrel domain
MDEADTRDWRGYEVIDPNGSKIGTIEDFFVDRVTDRPEWALVNTGLFGRKQTLVPFEGSQLDGNRLRVPYDKDLVKDAPALDPGETITEDSLSGLYRHYGIAAGAATGAADTSGDEGPRLREAEGGTYEIDPASIRERTGAEAGGLAERERELRETEADLRERQADLESRQEQLEDRETKLEERLDELAEREAASGRVPREGDTVVERQVVTTGGPSGDRDDSEVAARASTGTRLRRFSES